MKTIYESIYKKVLQLVPTLWDLEAGDALKSQGVSGQMPLNLDVLRKSENKMVIALAHNYIQNGDVMADPDMEIKIYQDMRAAEALTYQQDNLGIYQRVYCDEAETRFYPELKKQLNTFLNGWLSSCLNAGYILVDKK